MNLQPFAFLKQLEERPFQTIGVRILRFGAGLVLLFRAMTEWRYSEFLFNPVWIDPSFAPLIGKLLLLSWFVAGALFVMGKHTRLAALIALLAFLAAETSTVTHDGGDNVLRLLLLYMVFMLENHQFEKSKGIAVFLHNVAVLVSIVQICILYFVAGTTKLQGADWVNGTALYYVMHVDLFSANWTWLRQLMKNPIAVTAATYSAMVYQIGFPFMLNNRFHLPWLMLGLSFHIGIVVAMGLTTFGTIMITIVLFTIRDSEWRYIQTTIKLIRLYFSSRHKLVEAPMMSGD
jgi:hypothetical protein